MLTNSGSPYTMRTHLQHVGAQACDTKMECTLVIFIREFFVSYRMVDGGLPDIRILQEHCLDTIQVCITCASSARRLNYEFLQAKHLQAAVILPRREGAQSPVLVLLEPI